MVTGRMTGYISVTATRHCAFENRKNFRISVMRDIKMQETAV
jgi:hypothetical protein